MNVNKSQNDVVVIGGGVAGLAAATLLARAGRSVRLFEQSHALGGRAQTKRQDGFYLNIGPHALYRSGRGIEVLRELGIEPRGRVPSVSGAFAIKDGAKHTFPAGAVSLLTTSLFGLSAKLEAARLLASIGKIDGDRLRASTVVIASSPWAALAMVEDGELTSLAQWADEAVPVKAACFDLALRRLPIPKNTFALGIDRPLYFSVHSAAAQLAPEGCALIQAAKYLSIHIEVDDEERIRGLHAVLAPRKLSAVK